MPNEYIRSATVLLVAVECGGKEEVEQPGQVPVLRRVAAVGGDEGQQL